MLRHDPSCPAAERSFPALVPTPDDPGEGEPLACGHHADAWIVDGFGRVPACLRCLGGPDPVGALLPREPSDT